MEPTQRPAKKSLKFLLILIPAVVLISIGSLIFTYNLFFANTVSNFTDKNAGVDTSAIEDEIFGTIINVDTVNVTVGKDGLTNYLNISMTLQQGEEDLTSDQLFSIIHDAYHGSEGKVATIKIRVENATGEPIDIKPVAADLGIHYLGSINSISYSTNTLKKEFKD